MIDEIKSQPTNYPPALRNLITVANNVVNDGLLNINEVKFRSNANITKFDNKDKYFNIYNYDGPIRLSANNKKSNIELIGDRINIDANQLCIEDVCITKDHLRNLRDSTFKEIKMNTTNDSKGFDIVLTSKNGPSGNKELVVRSDLNSDFGHYLSVAKKDSINDTYLWMIDKNVRNTVLQKDRQYNHRLGTTEYWGRNHLYYPSTDKGCCNENKFKFF
jgi:hypothetical protein